MSGAGEQPVLILSGAPGVGKTTTAVALVERFPRAVHLESDRFFGFIRTGYIEPWKSESSEQNRTVMEIVAEAAKRYAAAGYFTLVDGIVIPGWYLEPIRDALREAGHEVAYAVLRAPLAVCIERVRGREGGSLFDAEAMDRLWNSFTDLGELEANVIEVDGMKPEDVAAELRDRLASGSLAVSAGTGRLSHRQRHAADRCRLFPYLMSQSIATQKISRVRPRPIALRSEPKAPTGVEFFGICGKNSAALFRKVRPLCINY